MRIIAIDKQSVFLLLGFLFILGFSYLLGFSPLLAVVIIAAVLHYKTTNDTAVVKSNLLQLGLLFTLMLASFVLLLNASGKSSYLLPLACVPMIVNILFSNQQLAMLMNITGAFSIVLLTKDANLSAVLFVGGTIGIISVKGIRHRSEILKSGLLVGLTQSFCLFLIQKGINTTNTFANNVGFNLANGFICAAVITVTLPIFEYLFSIATNITLLELSDFNHPLLKKLVIEAPGTYHHSLIVGNLSEAAAEAVGANSLLCRIGSYYHDIGKISKPEYFAENQMHISKHVNIKPSISKSIIMGHVKEGLDLAKQYKLKPIIIDFISQHHGTSVVYYFFRRALENIEEETALKEDVFRYPGPRPQIKETGIVLLADSVEAATRSIEDPNPTKIQNVVHRIINNKFVDGQLDHCRLTLKDLENIVHAFVRILTAIYHSRIPYPSPEE